MTTSVTRTSALILQGFIILIGIAVLGFLVLEPLHEGRNVNATLYEVYFHDWFLAYVYTASITFFVGLYQLIRLIGYMGQKGSSQEVIGALTSIQYCAYVFMAFIVGALGYLNIVQRKIEEDIAGGVAMCLFTLVVSGSIAMVARALRKRVQ